MAAEGADASDGDGAALCVGDGDGLLRFLELCKFTAGTGPLAC